MFCPTCGKEPEKLIDYMGMSVCPNCGCAIELSQVTTKKESIKCSKDYTSIKRVCTRTFAGISILISIMWIIVIYLLGDFFPFEKILYLIKNNFLKAMLEIDDFFTTLLRIALAGSLIINKKRERCKSIKILLILLAICEIIYLVIYVKYANHCFINQAQLLSLCFLWIGQILSYTLMFVMYKTNNKFFGFLSISLRGTFDILFITLCVIYGMKNQYLNYLMPLNDFFILVAALLLGTCKPIKTNESEINLDK